MKQRECRANSLGAEDDIATTNCAGLAPFLKWAGGKRWLVPHIHRLAPKRFRNYIEPFLGGGAVYFALHPPKAILADINSDLIETYQAIEANWLRVWALLKEHQNYHSKKYYYQIREQRPRSRHTRAARFLYLNRTCWNGLYRVNLAGQFNVPKGTKSLVVLPSDDFARVAQVLEGAELLVSDFEAVIDQASKNDLLFCDPPYTVKHNVNGFIKYNEKLFNWDDQVRLSRALGRAAQRGAMVILTNADHSAIRRMYKRPFTAKRIYRHSVISGDPAFRRRCTEVLITANLEI